MKNLLLLLTLFFLAGSVTAAVSFTYTVSNVKCNGGTTGSIQVVGSGGTSPYKVSVNNGTSFLTGTTATGLTAGTYDVVVKDATGAVSSAQSIGVTQPAKLAVTFTTTKISCAGSADGTITFTATGGTPPYKYSRNGGQTYQTSNVFTNVPGTATGFQSRILDANNCLLFGPTVFINGPTAVTFVSITAIPVTCFGANDGKIIALAQGGNHTFVYSIDGGLTYPSSGTFNGLAPGTYSVRAKDSKGCLSTIKSATVTEPAKIETDAVTCYSTIFGWASTSCATLNAGNVTGGIPPYSYSWSNGMTTASINVCPEQTTVYQLSIKDSKNCVINVPITVNVYDARCSKSNGQGKGNPNHKVEVCHVPPGNPANEHTICIDKHGVPAHVLQEPGHFGCRIGPCDLTDPCAQNAKAGENTEKLHFGRNILVYPNASAGEFKVDFDVERDGHVTLSVLTMNGVLIDTYFDGNVVSGELQSANIDLNDHQDGVYLVQLKTADGESHIARYIKRN